MYRLRNILLAALGGVALNAAFPDASWWPLAFVAVGALWWALEQATGWSGFGLGWVFGIAFFLPHLWWAYTAVGPVPWIALAAVEALAFALLGGSWAHVRRSHMLAKQPWAQAPTFALLWVGFEQLRSMVPFGGFPWGRMAFSQADSPLARLAWLGGVPLVSFIAVCVGALLGLGFEALRKRLPLRAAVAPFAGAVLIVVGYAVPLSTQASDGTLVVGVVQGNVPNAGLDAFAQAHEVTENHLAQTLVLADSTAAALDLLVWPENSADFDPRTDDYTFSLVTEAAQSVDAPLLLGTNDFSPAEGRYNTSLLLAPDGAVLAAYHKQRPAPFAEYIPIRPIARAFSADVDRVRTDVIGGDGVGTVVMSAPRLERTVTVGTIICFEVAYDSIVRESVAGGAELVIVQTNNANFGVTAESTQQLAMTRLRAIETGRATIQASTVGVSAIVAPNGRIVEMTGLFTAEHMVAEVPLRTAITPAVRLGEFLEWMFLLLPGVFVIRAVIQRVGDRYEW